MNDQTPTYDTIGVGYNIRRSADPRILQRLEHWLEQPSGASILDVGAGTGNYTKALADRGYKMWALEPSTRMSESCTDRADIHWVQGRAEAMPFADETFDGVYCTLALHHFADQALGMKEMRRVLRPGGRLVIFTSDPRRARDDFWMRHYFAELFEQAEQVFPAIANLERQLRSSGFSRIEVEPYAIPADNCDGFFCSSWQRPHDYLDAAYRAGISSFRLMEPNRVEEAVRHLAEDLRSGHWQARFGATQELAAYDAGYVFVICRADRH